MHRVEISGLAHVSGVLVLYTYVGCARYWRVVKRIAGVGWNCRGTKPTGSPMQRHELVLLFVHSTVNGRARKNTWDGGREDSEAVRVIETFGWWRDPARISHSKKHREQLHQLGAITVIRRRLLLLLLLSDSSPCFFVRIATSHETVVAQWREGEREGGWKNTPIDPLRARDDRRKVNPKSGHSSILFAFSCG